MIKDIAKLMLGKRIMDRMLLKFPYWSTFNVNLSRLYPYMLTGGSAAYRSFMREPLDKDKVVDLTLPRQSVFACGECIRSFFSILKEGAGVVCLAVTEAELGDDSRTLLPIHYAMFRDYLYPDTGHNRRKVKYPLLLQPLWTLECLGVTFPGRKSARSFMGGVNYR